MISKTHIGAQKPHRRQLNAKVSVAKVPIFVFLTGIAAPQDGHKRLVLQVSLGSNTSVQCYT